MCMAVATSGGDGQGGSMTTARRISRSRVCTSWCPPNGALSHFVTAVRGPAPPPHWAPPRPYLSHFARTLSSAEKAAALPPSCRLRSCRFVSARVAFRKYRVSSALHPSVYADQEETHKMPSMDQDRWTRVRDRLRAEVGDDVYSSWFARMELDGSEGDTVKLSVPTRFLKSWIQSHYAERVLACWQAEQPDFSRIELTVRSAVIRTLPPKLKPLEVTAGPRDARENKVNGSDARGTVGPISAVHDALGGSPLDPRLTFETFVVGRSNTLAHAAAKQVAQGRRGDAVMFNPLYIPAGVGLGKTHLLQSLAWAGNTSTERKVLYLTAEKFMYGFVAALRAQNALAFKDALRTIDVLVIDDLQFLQGKSTQAEFCHTLNALIDAGRQVVIAADRPPADLESLDERVRSRLAGGLVVEMGSLGEELRLEILKSRVAAARSHHAGFDVPSPVLGFIAKQVTH